MIAFIHAVSTDFRGERAGLDYPPRGRGSMDLALRFSGRWRAGSRTAFSPSGILLVFCFAEKWAGLDSNQ
jgi:hypothetical protein